MKEKGRHTFRSMPPHVSVTSHGAQVASQQNPIFQASGGMIPWLMKQQEEVVVQRWLTGRLYGETMGRKFHLRHPVWWSKIWGKGIVLRGQRQSNVNQFIPSRLRAAEILKFTK